MLVGIEGDRTSVGPMGTNSMNGALETFQKTGHSHVVISLL